jgi:hypothetical protein
VYDDYMTRLTSSAERFVCIYSSNTEKVSPDPHVRHRVFCDWMTGNAPSWELFLKIDNPFPEDASVPMTHRGQTSTSIATASSQTVQPMVDSGIRTRQWSVTGEVSGPPVRHS